MWASLLMAAAAAIANALIGRFFPGHPKVTPEVIAQAQKDRADILQSQKDARKQADEERAAFRARAAAGAVAGVDPELRKRDANQRD